MPHHPYRPAYAAQARAHCRLGASEEDLAELFGVDAATILRWRSAIPAFASALRLGATEADDLVEDSLFRKATGARVPAVKIFVNRESSKPDYEIYVEHYAPDTAACLAWLKHRRPEVWGSQRASFDLDAAYATDAADIATDEPGPENPVI